MTAHPPTRHPRCHSALVAPRYHPRVRPDDPVQSQLLVPCQARLSAPAGRQHRPGQRGDRATAVGGREVSAAGRDEVRKRTARGSVATVNELGQRVSNERSHSHLHIGVAEVGDGHEGCLVLAGLCGADACSAGQRLRAPVVFSRRRLLGGVKRSRVQRHGCLPLGAIGQQGHSSCQGSGRGSIVLEESRRGHLGKGCTSSN